MHFVHFIQVTEFSQQNIPGFTYLPQKTDTIVIDYSRYIREVIVKLIFSLLKVAEHHF
jgi:hypothetical protein